MAITPLPPAPLISDSPADFNNKAFAWVDSLGNFTTELNAELPTINDAIPASQAAVAAANFKGEWSTLTGALNIPASVSHNDRVWVLTENLADVTAVEPGTDARWINVTEKLPVGALQYFAGATTTTYPGNEWLLCDGSIVTQTAYSELFGRVGLIIDGFNNWTARTSGTASQINALTYGDGVFVYSGAGGVLATSTDAITWTARTSGISSEINALTYGNGTFVYAGFGGVLRTSTDGIAWTARTSGTGSNILALTYGNGTFVYAGQNGILATSTDGIAWTARTSGTGSTIAALTHGNGTFVYAGVGGVLRTSTDGITWTARTSGTTSTILALTYGDGTFVYGGGGGVLRTSTDGITWTARTSGTTSAINALTYGDGVFVYSGVGGVLGASTDGIAWTARTSGTGSTIRDLTHNNGTFVYAGLGGVLATAGLYNYDANTEFALPTTNSVSLIEPTTNQVFIKAE